MASVSAPSSQTLTSTSQPQTSLSTPQDCTPTVLSSSSLVSTAPSFTPSILVQQASTLPTTGGMTPTWPSHRTPQQDLYERSPHYYLEHVRLTLKAKRWVETVSSKYWYRSDLTQLDHWLLYHLLPYTVNRTSGGLRFGDGKRKILALAEVEHPLWVFIIRWKVRYLRK